MDVTGGWRNGLVFDPLKKYGNYSYAEFMLIPLADALNSVITDEVTVTFALQVRRTSPTAVKGRILYRRSSAESTQAVQLQTQQCR
jgi:hypothetical protein